MYNILDKTMKNSNAIMFTLFYPLCECYRVFCTKYRNLIGVCSSLYEMDYDVFYVSVFVVVPI